MLFTINCLSFSSRMTSRILASQASKQHAAQKRPFGLWLRGFMLLVQPNYHGFWSFSWPLCSIWSAQSQNPPVPPHLMTNMVGSALLLPWKDSHISVQAGGPKPDHPLPTSKHLSNPVQYQDASEPQAVLDLTCCPSRHIHQDSTLFRHPGGWINFPRLSKMAESLSLCKQRLKTYLFSQHSEASWDLLALTWRTACFHERKTISVLLLQEGILVPLENVSLLLENVLIIEMHVFFSLFVQSAKW